MRYVIVALLAFALLAAGAAYELRAPSRTEVPAIQLRPIVESERSPTKPSQAPPKRKKPADTESEAGSGGGGAAPAPAPAPADDDDDDGSDDGDDGGDD
jgi:hypothetical protein